jgi:hypothetical protein
MVWRVAHTDGSVEACGEVHLALMLTDHHGLVATPNLFPRILCIPQNQVKQVVAGFATERVKRPHVGRRGSGNGEIVNLISKLLCVKRDCPTTTLAIEGHWDACQFLWVADTVKGLESLGHRSLVAVKVLRPLSPTNRSLERLVDMETTPRSDKLHIAVSKTLNQRSNIAFDTLHVMLLGHVKVPPCPVNHDRVVVVGVVKRIEAGVNVGLPVETVDVSDKLVV